jgi:hypothetical protein
MASLTLVVESARIASQARVLMLYTQSAITEVPPPKPLQEIRFPWEKWQGNIVYLTVSNIPRI